MRYTGESLREICFPLGGIGTGSIGLAGNGRLMDFEIFNRPNKGSLNGYTHFAVRAVKGGVCTARVLNGDYMDSRMGQYASGRFSGYGYGVDKHTMAGFPHFSQCEFTGEFPYALLKFGGGAFPAEMSLTAFSPFIPLDEFNSSLPAAFFEITFENTQSEALICAAALSFQNPYAGKGVNAAAQLENGAGVFMYNAIDGKNSPDYGDVTVATPDKDAQVQCAWYRGSWQDSVTTFWNEFSCGGRLRERSYGADSPRNDHATVMSEFTLAPGEKHAVRFVIAWSNPTCFNYWNPLKDSSGRDVTWKNWYATQFETSLVTCEYALKNRDSLDRRSRAFREALFSSTLEPYVLDAAASTLSVLKSPTVMRLEDGSFYGFEGVHEHSGSCEGTCQHVWNYAYALAFLFPALQRSTLENEFRYSMDENGDMEFRLKLPLGRPFTRFRPCVDGQMGAVIRTYREWLISGDTEWLTQVYPSAVKALEFAFSPANRDEWDKNADGVIDGRQHHTLDMELFGPNSWLEGFYLAALRAGERIARAVGDVQRAEKYAALFEQGYEWTRKNLFNGRYFIQKINLEDRSSCERFSCPDYWNEETGEMKYQIGEGSSIDQMCAQWHADIVGLGRIFDKEQTDTALESMLEINFRPSMRDFANPWRVFSLNDEAGTLICGYPDGARKPRIPVPYCEETMTGFEYQFAGLLTAEGRYADGVNVVKAIRKRYDGRYRNPYNEIECGGNYARAMAAFALLPLSAGFSFDLARGHIGFDPVVGGEFRCIWSVGSGWGSFSTKPGETVIHVTEGTLTLKTLELPFLKTVTRVIADGQETAFSFDGGCVSLDGVTLRSEIRIMSAG